MATVQAERELFVAFVSKTRVAVNHLFGADERLHGDAMMQLECSAFASKAIAAAFKTQFAHCLNAREMRAKAHRKFPLAPVDVIGYRRGAEGVCVSIRGVDASSCKSADASR
jgi:hypothetical protein